MPRPRNFRSAPFRERVHVDDREETKGDREKSFSQFAPKRNTWNTGKLRERERKKFVYNEILSRYAIKSMQIRLDCSRDRFVNIQRGVRWIDRAEEAWVASSLRGEERYRVRWGTVHRTAFRVGLAISRDTVRRWRHASFRNTSLDPAVFPPHRIIGVQADDTISLIYRRYSCHEYLRRLVRWACCDSALSRMVCVHFDLLLTIFLAHKINRSFLLQILPPLFLSRLSVDRFIFQSRKILRY